VNFGGNGGEGPATSEVRGEKELDAVDHSLITEGSLGATGGAWSEGALKESQGEALCLERFDGAFAEAIAKHGDKSLSAGIDAMTVRTEGAV
jgi:hypothetical protein